MHAPAQPPADPDPASAARRAIPHRADTLRVLRLIGRQTPMLMLVGDDEGYGTRWTLGGQQVQPAIARYLMEQDFIAETGTTEFGARLLTLTTAGTAFRDCGTRWWEHLSLLEKLRAIIWG